ncbi:MAG: hypothetical protein KDJ75_07970 [Alphaproteobacteria bacterium]|nr:hypothetical protein [Alphaproteobacteria bacterium]
MLLRKISHIALLTAFFSALLLFGGAFPAFAAGETEPASVSEQEQSQVQAPQEQGNHNAIDPALERRLKLAEEMHKLRPVRDQVESAIEQYAQTQPPEDRAAFISAMRSVLNPKALERISIDAYAQVYTEPELKAMVEYYTKPEARSASDKYSDYAKIVYPEIVRMLDKAAMRVRTGGTGPQ